MIALGTAAENLPDDVNGAVTMETYFILFLLGIFIIYSFWLLIKDKKKESYLFLSYVLLIFVIIYCVSILDYKIGGTNISVEKLKKEIYSDVNKAVLLNVADIYITSALEAGRFPHGGFALQKNMIEKRDAAKKMLENADVEEIEIQEKTDKIDNVIAKDIANKIQDSVRVELRKSKPDKEKEFNAEFDNIVENAELKKSPVQEIKELVDKYDVANEDVTVNIEELDYFIKNRYLK